MPDQGYFVVLRHQPVGPFTRREVTELLLRGRLFADCPCCPEGEEKWTPLHHHIQAAPLLAGQRMSFDWATATVKIPSRSR